MYVCMYIRVYVLCMYVCIYTTYTCVYTYVCMYVCMYVCTWVGCFLEYGETHKRVVEVVVVFWRHTSVLWRYLGFGYARYTVIGLTLVYWDTVPGLTLSASGAVI
jgi:hypothetical protein